MHGHTGHLLPGSPARNRASRGSAVILAYPPAVLIADCARAGAGAMACLAPLPWLPPQGPAFWALLALALTFVAYGALSLRRRRRRYALTPDGLAADRGPPVHWSRLERLSLHYYSTRRDREAGWMELTLSGAGVTVRVDSHLEGVEKVVRRAARAARASGVALSAASTANLAALDLAAPEEEGAR